MPAPKDPEKYALWRQRIQETCNSPDVVSRMSAAKKGKPGRKKAQAEKDKIAESNTHRVYSDATRAKISHARRNSPVQKRGSYPPSPTTIGKMREKRLAYWDNLTDGQKQEYLEKLRVGRTKQWRSLTDEQRAERVAKTIREPQALKASAIEDVYAAILDGQGITYWRQWKIGRFYVDFYIPSEMRVVEILGCYWHCCSECGFTDALPGKQEKDAQRLEYLRKRGYTVEVVWEHELSKKKTKRKIAS